MLVVGQTETTVSLVLWEQTESSWTLHNTRKQTARDTETLKTRACDSSEHTSRAQWKLLLSSDTRRALEDLRQVHGVSRADLGSVKPLVLCAENLSVFTHLHLWLVSRVCFCENWNIPIGRLFLLCRNYVNYITLWACLSVELHSDWMTLISHTTLWIWKRKNNKFIL